MPAFSAPLKSPPHAVPWTCQCAHPAPNGGGECVECNRPVATHLFDSGRPPVACRPVAVADIRPGEAIWDGRDRRFYFVAEPAGPCGWADWLVTLTIDGVGPEDYDRRAKLCVACDTRAAETYNALAECAA